MNESGHQFRRYVKRVVGRKAMYQALCECGWLSPIGLESSAWARYCEHSEEAAQ
jgi:hypothetical protein